MCSPPRNSARSMPNMRATNSLVPTLQHNMQVHNCNMHWVLCELTHKHMLQQMAPFIKMESNSFMDMLMPPTSMTHRFSTTDAMRPVQQSETVPRWCGRLWLWLNSLQCLFGNPFVCLRNRIPKQLLRIQVLVSHSKERQQFLATRNLIVGRFCWPIRSLHSVPVPHWTSFTREIFGAPIPRYRYLVVE